MAHSSSPAGQRNLSPAHPNEGDDERWKTSPTKETPGDRGENARKERRYRQDQNVPGPSPARRSKSPRARP